MFKLKIWFSLVLFKFNLCWNKYFFFWTNYTGWMLYFWYLIFFLCIVDELKKKKEKNNWRRKNQLTVYTQELKLSYYIIEIKQKRINKKIGNRKINTYRRCTIWIHWRCVLWIHCWNWYLEKNYFFIFLFEHLKEDKDVLRKKIN